MTTVGFIPGRVETKLFREFSTQKLKEQMMHKRTLVTPRVVGTAMFLMVATTWGIFAKDGASSTGDANTPPTASATKPVASTNDQITLLKKQMALQQQQIEQMQKALAEQNRLLEQLSKPAPATEQAAQPATPAQPAKAVVNNQQASQQHSTGLGEVASTSPVIPQSQKKADNAIAPIGGGSMSAAAISKAGGPNDETSPLQFHIGNATLMPVGFMDFTGVFRSKTAGGNIGTSFGSIPYQAVATNGTTPYQTNLSEFRLSMQNSRIGFRADADVHGAHVMGYMEADFLGTPASTNIAVSTNSNLLRSRLYWVDVRKGAFEILGGQTWSLLTPGRTGISPLPADIFYGQGIDVNYLPGLFWGRIPELRFVYHPNKHAALAFALDSPDQYGGGSSGGGTVILPAALNTPYSGEIDFGASSGGIATPNLAPDLIAKLALDPNKHVHFEIGGLERNFKVYDTNTSVSYTKVGGGGFVNLHVEPVKGFRLLTNNYWSDGGGRYIFGQAPDLIAGADGNISLVHSGSTASGIEITHKNTLLYAYYSGIYIMRDTAIDTGKTTPTLGYGFSGSSSGQNRDIQQITFGFNRTIWKDAKWGAVNFMGQYAYLLRDPWYVNFATGQPPNANNNMVFFNLRYTLPGSAPTMGK
jgi:hypothetical protein